MMAQEKKGTLSASLKPPQKPDVTEMIKKRLEGVKNKIIILSGKGGVGKSTVTSNLAAVFAKEMNKTVGVFDYDFHGPAIPKMLGVKDRELKAFPLGIFPVTGVLNIKVISMALLLPDEKTPVIWRGPLKYNALREFMSNVIWGNLDYLLFDLPPGTGDEALNIAQNIPGITGAIVVTIPSEVSRIAVERSAEFCKILKIKLLGVIENMSMFKCPKCGYEVRIFGKDGARQISKDMGIPLLGEIPLDPAIAESMDKGEPLILSHENSPATIAFKEIARKIEQEIGKQ